MKNRYRTAGGMILSADFVVSTVFIVEKYNKLCYIIVIKIIRRDSMLTEKLYFKTASEQDIPFISEVYNQNINALHGNNRSFEDWKKLISVNNSTYYIALSSEPVGWFRIDIDKEVLWLGMIQVKPRHQGKGVGKNILSFVENLAKDKQIHKIGIHTTEDNISARNLYISSGYSVSLIGKCTTADGVERIGYTFFKHMIF